jgi:hypothetical protein
MATEQPSAESLELARGICPFEANHRLERTGIPCPNCVAMALLLDRTDREARLEEAEQWDANAARPQHFIPFCDIVHWAEERIAELQAAQEK